MMAEPITDAEKSQRQADILPFATVSFTRVESENRLTKSIRLEGSKIVKSGDIKLTKGRAYRHKFTGAPADILQSLAGVLQKLGPNEAIITAPPLGNEAEYQIVTKERASTIPGAIARTRTYFAPVAGTALFGMDFDTAEFPPDLLAKIGAAGKISSVLAEVYPPLANAAMLLRPSASCGVRQLGQKAPEPSGQHRYYVVNEGEAIESFTETLNKRLMLAGYLWGKITATGAVLPRSLFDIEASKDPTRLFYEADAVLGDGLEYAPGARDPRVTRGGLLDITSIEPLTEEEQARLDAAIEELKKRLEPEAAPIRAAYKEQRAKALIARGTNPDIARRLVEHALERYELSGDEIIHTDQQGAVSVRDILADREAFHKKTCADPNEPEYNGGQNVGVIYTDSTPVRIFSHAHGGINYTLHPAIEDILDVIEDDQVADQTGDTSTGVFSGLGEGEGVFEDKPATTSAVAALGLHNAQKPIAPQSLPVRKWIVEPRFAPNTVTLGVGAPGVSKSTLALRDGLAIAANRPDLLHGLDANGNPIGPDRLHVSGPVIIYDAEDPLSEMQRRLAAMKRFYGLNDGDLKHQLILWSGVDRPLTLAHRDDAKGFLKRFAGDAKSAGADHLEQVIRETGAVLVWLVPLIDLASGGAENDTDRQKELVGIIRRVAETCGVSIGVAHHTPKAASDAPGDMNSARGAGSAVGVARGMFTLVNVTGERSDEKSWGVSREDDLFRLDYAKVQYGKLPKEPVIIRRMSKPVGNGSGMAPTEAAALFGESPRERLEAMGDFAPVLTVVSAKDLAAINKTRNRDDEKAQRIAVIIDALMGDRDEMKVSDLVSPAAVKLQEDGICNTKHRPTITGEIRVALFGKGVRLERDGQTVHLHVEQKGRGPTSPLWVVRTTKQDGAADEA
ncbi:AAA family ATPase [Pelagibacterium sp.]|uniref:AAA family ATPase n=1 Tax=Pelagibacterium sp. TaxID=1967288 RepID=UPI003A8F40D5